MKKTIIYTAFWLATAGIALTSCEDIFGGFLDKQPSNELTEEEVFSQWTTTREFHFDTYNFLRHGRMPHQQLMDGCSYRLSRNQLRQRRHAYKFQHR